MTVNADRDLDAKDIILGCAADLAENVSAASVYARLRKLEPRIAASPLLRPEFLRVRAVAANRLGIPREALGDLQEARQILAQSSQWRELAEVDRTIAVVQGWRGDGREAALALLRAVAGAATATDRAGLASALIEAGRLEMEIGRPHEAELFFSHALHIGSDGLSTIERARGAVARLQALVAAGRFDEARLQIEESRREAADAPPRLRFLVELEAARVSIKSGLHDAGRRTLEAARALIPDGPDAFEKIEHDHVESELAIATGDAALACAKLRAVVTRYAADDLAGREVVARLLHGQALAESLHFEEADRMLAAALRRAIGRGLSGYADQVRSAIAGRDGTSAWSADQALVTGSHADIARRFVRRRPLGSGGFGDVARAYDLELGLEVALKRIPLAGAYDPATRRRLLAAARTEIAATSRIEHPGIARAFGLLADERGDAFVVRELVEGRTLRDAIQAGLEPPAALEILSRVAYALASVHAAGVVHRDLKPENIILRRDDAPVLIDFGVAVIDSHLGGGGQTRGYAAPEQRRGRSVDARADLYSLGVIARELLSAAKPAGPTTSRFALASEPWSMRRRRRQLIELGSDPELADTVSRLLAEHPYWRPRSAADVARQFAQAAARERARLQKS